MNASVLLFIIIILKAFLLQYKYCKVNIYDQEYEPITYHTEGETHCQLTGHTKVSQFGLSLQVEENVASFDVSVDLPFEVEVL